MGLSKTFVDSLKILFDVLDETQTGVIKFNDLAYQSKSEGQDGLPHSVLSVLRTLQDSRGNISFESLVKGFEVVKSGQTFGQKIYNKAHVVNSKDHNSLGSDNTSAFHPVHGVKYGQNMHLNARSNGHIPSTLSKTAMLHSKSDDMLNVKPNVGFQEYHGDFFRPKERWDRKPGDGRSSVATSSALEHMSNFFCFVINL